MLDHLIPQFSPGVVPKLSTMSLFCRNVDQGQDRSGAFLGTDRLHCCSSCAEASGSGFSHVCGDDTWTARGQLE